MQKTSFEPVLESAKAARDFVRQAVNGAEGLDIDMIVLLATELATNAILHSRLPFEVTVALTANCAQVCVDDLSSMLPSVTRPADTETSGRGLGMVAAGSARWGIKATDAGKRAWFEVCRSPVDETVPIP